MEGDRNAAARPQGDAWLRLAAVAGNELQPVALHHHGQDDLGLQKGEGVADAGARPGAERQVGIARPVLGALR